MTVEVAFHVPYNRFIAIFVKKDCKLEGSRMEQLNLSTVKDPERVYKILGELIHMDREFQIMITVPSPGQKPGEEEIKIKPQEKTSIDLDRKSTRLNSSHE